ncbi:uncharacterized protein PFL1_06138 [Pseudozyma flocculosa PF-1]|uniref:Related to quinate transport protein n=2 Tax=Pseudozyma flocculosa TaxID=84751 RepID=A0A5C3F7X9_9BASI|nr:uncharacterized protein PFL1_06138 [Pseudozyma flocculosa PF-1]EPQ26203.1 hypothetical protein PFL1_06138 [Pseudozyma flocculosa PF-1]SPO40156.1 related to quinate transport protein [Pseudozyma flocculosa]
MASTAKESFFVNIHVYFLALIAYFGIFLFGWETGVAGGVVSQQFFLDAFGLKDKKKVSSIVVAILQAGAFVGSLPAPVLSNKYGRKKVLFGYNLIIALGSTLQTVPGVGDSVVWIYVGRIVAGFGIGGITSIASGYVSECCPKNVRGRITGMFQVIVAAGVMVSYFVNYGSKKNLKGAQIWRVPFGFQLVPSGLMAIGLLFAKESPRWLAKVGRTEEALRNLAFLRRKRPDSDEVVAEMAEINAAIREEQLTQVTLKSCITTKGTNIRFFIAFLLFVFQQWSGQNTVSYFSPQIFKSIGYKGETSALLASGIYGVVKFAATGLWVFYGVETVGRRWSLFSSTFGMGVLFFIIGGLLKNYPPDANAASPSASSQAMAAMVYLIAVVYSLGVGPLCWVYVSEIFSNGTRHWGLALASATQWLFNFSQAWASPYIIEDMGYKAFFFFGALNIGGFAVFAFFLPETKNKSLEDMDIIFGSITQEQRDRDMAKAQEDIDYSKAHVGHLDSESRGRDGASVEDEKKSNDETRYRTTTP